MISAADGGSDGVSTHPCYRSTMGFSLRAAKAPMSALLLSSSSVAVVCGFAIGGSQGRNHQASSPPVSQSGYKSPGCVIDESNQGRSLAIHTIPLPPDLLWLESLELSFQMCDLLVDTLLDLQVLLILQSRKCRIVCFWSC
ncbi:uncharacterized protein [Arachis hypogaea]|uniref:uncharacterized protein isoform X2 n=1 Tax=Arachis hypogaea TaxID=3818 RepID=UPI000DEC4606|nr:uncharacterized protein LOC112796007 isoform X2 [Arachis hypogaea]